MKTFKKGDIITVRMPSGEYHKGEFLRYYGKNKAQIRTADWHTSRIGHGTVIKVTGEIVPADKEIRLAVESQPAVQGSKTRIGKVQLKTLELLRVQPKTSFRQLAEVLSIPIPRAARIIKSLCEAKLIKKTISETGNVYEVLRESQS